MGKRYRKKPNSYSPGNSGQIMRVNNLTISIQQILGSFVSVIHHIYKEPLLHRPRDRWLLRFALLGHDIFRIIRVLHYCSEYGSWFC